MPIRNLGQRNGLIQPTTEERAVTSGVTVTDGDLVKLAQGGRVTNGSMASGKIHGMVNGGPSDDLVSRNYRQPETTGDSDGTKTVLVEGIEGCRLEIPVNGSLASDAEGSYYLLVGNSSVLLTSNGTSPANNDTVTIGGVTYTFKTTLTGAANEVLIGANAAAALDNLKSAVNDTGTEGTHYGTGTVANTVVTATTNTNTTQLFEAIDQTADGYTLEVSESSANLSFDTTTLTGGTGRQTVDNLTKSATVGQLLCLERIPTNAAGTEFKRGIFEVAAPASRTTVS